MSFYGTLAEADTYHSDRGNTTWTGADSVKNVALLRGSEYIDQAFRSSFPGLKTDGRSQVREWPRTSASDIEGNSIGSTTVPTEVKEASYEAALRELVEAGSLLPDYDPADQVKRVKVGAIEVEPLQQSGVRSVLPIITAIRGILAPVLTGPVTSSVAGYTARV